MLSYKRSTRVAELIQHEISKIILEMKDPKLGFTTVLGVDLTGDMKFAKVFYSVLGDDEVKKSTIEVIGKARNFIRYTLGQRINLRCVPVLEFRCDSTPERAGKVFDLLHKIEREKEEAKNIGKPTKRPAAKKAGASAKMKIKKAGGRRKTKK